MRRDYWTNARISGLLLVLGMVLTLAWVVLLLARGELRGLEAAFRGVEGIGEDAQVFRTVDRFQLPASILLLLGFGMLTVALREMGDKSISFLALNLFVVAFVFLAIEGTFHSSLTVWAGLQWERTGTVPEFYEPLRDWGNRAVQAIYMPFGLLSMAGYGWAILRTGLLSRGVAWATIAWSLLVLVLVLPPAVLFVPAVLLGIALLVS